MARIVRPSPLRAVYGHEHRLRGLERREPAPWIYVAESTSDPLMTALSPAFENAWQNVGAPYARLSFRLLGGTLLDLRGRVKNPTLGEAALGTVVTVLPEDFRPEHNERFPGSTDNTLIVCTWELATNGELMLAGATAG